MNALIRMILWFVCMVVMLLCTYAVGDAVDFTINSACSGDFDDDGDVDGTDLAVFEADFGRTDCGSAPPCEGDFDTDGDVDGSDLAMFAADFGRTDCYEVLPPAPLNQFNIGDSIGEGEAAYDDIWVVHHETVWSTGFDAGDTVYSLNERFEDADPINYDENDGARDAIFNHAMRGAKMADFITQANGVAAAASSSDSGKAGMVTILLGNNDVCTDPENGQPLMTDPETFELEYRAGLDVLSASDTTKNAFIHISSIPAIYWLWNAKMNDFWCWFIVWQNVPCHNLLDNPIIDDCASMESRLDPDNIDVDDGPNCIRRKQFHQDIRDIYNPVLRDVLQEYVDDGRLPNAYFVDIFDIQFGTDHINDNDCFHPSVKGHALLAEEQWCGSPWSIGDPLCMD